MSDTYQQALLRIADEGADATAELVKLQSDPRHKRDAMVTSDKPSEVDLLEMLVETGMLGLDPTTAAWVGPLVTYSETQATEPMKKGLGVLLAYLQTSNRPLPVYSKPQFASLFNNLVSVIIALGVPAEVVATYVRTMTGGRIFDHVTVADLETDAIQLLRSRIQERWESEFRDTIEPVTTSGTATVSDIAAALRTAATNLEA